MEGEGEDAALHISQLSLGSLSPSQQQSSVPKSPSQSTPSSENSPHEASATNKKRKKKKKTKCSLHPLANTTALPSQKWVEAYFPWKIVVKPRRGRCAIATRVIKAGELVISEQALVFVPRSNYRTSACHICCKDLSESSPGVQCASCKYSEFCKQCKTEANSLHRECCPILNAISSISEQADCDGDLLRLVLLLALNRSSAIEEPKQVPVGGADEQFEEEVIKGGIVRPSFQDAMGLQTHKEKVSSAWKSSVRKGCEALYDYVSEHVVGFKSNIEDLEFLAALINANAHGMGAQGLHNTDIAIGIFPFVSMLNHSCRPNCCFASEGDAMHVRAMQDIPQDTELCLSYINLYESRRTRRHQLAMTKHFDCGCPRCMEPLSSSVDRFLEGVMCNVKGCGGVLVRKGQVTSNGSDNLVLVSWGCDLCSSVLHSCTSTVQSRPLSERPWDLEAQAQEKLNAAAGLYKERRFKDARILYEDFVSEFTGKLHPLHVLLFDALTPLMNCCRVLGDAEGGVRVCRKIISCMEKVLNGPSLELSNFYFCLGEMCLERADAVDISVVLARHYRKQAQEAFNQVRHMRKICLGQPSLPS